MFGERKLEARRTHSATLDVRWTSPVRRRSVYRLIETEDKVGACRKTPDDGGVVPTPSAPSLDLIGTIHLLLDGAEGSRDPIRTGDAGELRR